MTPILIGACAETVDDAASVAVATRATKTASGRVIGSLPRSQTGDREHSARRFRLPGTWPSSAIVGWPRRSRAQSHPALATPLWAPSTLGFLDPVRQKAEQGDVLDGALLGTFRKRGTTGIPDAEDGTLEQMHHPFLLVEVSLVRQVVERQDGTILREHSPDERRAIEIVATRALLAGLDQRLRGREHRFPVIPVEEKVAGHVQDPRVQVEPVEVGRRGWCCCTSPPDLLLLLPEALDEAVEDSDHLTAPAFGALHDLVRLHVDVHRPRPDPNMLVLPELG